MTTQLQLINIIIIINFLEYYCSVELWKCSKTATATDVSFTDQDETEIGNSEQLEGENIFHDQKMEGGSSKKEQPSGIKRGGKIQKLTAVDIGKQYLDSLKEIGNEWRRSWLRISVTILIEQKRHRLIYIYIYIYI